MTLIAMLINHITPSLLLSLLSPSSSQRKNGEIHRLRALASILLTDLSVGVVSEASGAVVFNSLSVAVTDVEDSAVLVVGDEGGGGLLILGRASDGC